MLPSAFLFVYYNKYNCGGIGNEIFSCLAGPNLMSSYYCKYYGYDDYNILLAIISPLVWMYESFRFVREADIPIAIVYFTTLVFWYLIGYALDRLIRKLKN